VLLDEYGLDPGLAAEYSPDRTALYVYPRMGPELGDHFDELRSEAVRELLDLSREAYQHGFEPPEVQERVQRERRELGAFGREGDARLAAEYVRRSGTEQSAALALMLGHVGLTQRGFYNAIVQSSYVHYFFELGGVNLSVSMVGNVPQFMKDFAVGSDVSSDDVGLRDIAIRLRLMDVIDLGREHLDARFANCAAAVELEAAAILLKSLKTFARLKPSDGPRRAAALATRYRDALLGRDLTGKVELARAVADLHRHYRRQLSDERSRLILEVYAHEATAIAEDLPLAWGMLGLAYQELRFQLPPALQSLAESMGDRPPAPSASPAADMGALAVGQELREQHARLQADVDAFSTTWRLSAGERRRRGFSAMQQALVRGSTSRGAELLGGVTKDEARQLVDIVAGLDVLTQRVPASEVAEQLAAVLAEEQALRDQVATLRTTAQTAGVLVGSVGIPAVRHVVELVQANWPSYRQLIIDTWPGDQGQEVVRRLESMLGGVPPS
jgi:hypothetical protein